MNKLTLSILTFGLISLTGCSVFSPVKSNPPNSYLVNTMPKNIPTGKKSSKTLLVMSPNSSAAYNTSQIAYFKRPFEVSYFIENQWIASPSNMLMPLIQETLQKTNRFKAVVMPPYAGSYDYILSTNITSFAENLLTTHPTFTVSLHANIIQINSNKLLVTKEFKSSVPLQAATPYSAVIAANQATAIVLKQLATFCIDAL